MNILVSNDDGINASGIRHLIDALTELEGAEIYVCAPDRQRSAAGHSISTARGPLMVNDVEIPGVKWAQSVSGTPADCVKSGIKRLRREQGVEMDVVFTGINHGSNIGTDVYYSGTVSAALEGVMNHVPSVAVSVGTHHPTEEQLANCATIIKEVCEKAVPSLSSDTALNINFPDLPPDEVKGLKICRIGPREYDEKFDILTNPYGQKYYWYSGDLVHYDDLPEDMDVMAFQDGYATITPLRLDITDYDLLDAVSGWDLKIRP